MGMIREHAYEWLNEIYILYVSADFLHLSNPLLLQIMKSHPVQLLLVLLLLPPCHRHRPLQRPRLFPPSPLTVEKLAAPVPLFHSHLMQ